MCFRRKNERNISQLDFLSMHLEANFGSIWFSCYFLNFCFLLSFSLSLAFSSFSSPFSFLPITHSHILTQHSCFCVYICVWREFYGYVTDHSFFFFPIFLFLAPLISPAFISSFIRKKNNNDPSSRFSSLLLVVNN